MAKIYRIYQRTDQNVPTQNTQNQKNQAQNTHNQVTQNQKTQSLNILKPKNNRIKIRKAKIPKTETTIQIELEIGTRRAQIPRKPLIFPSPNKQTNNQTNKQTNKTFCPHRGSNSRPSRF